MLIFINRFVDVQGVLKSAVSNYYDEVKSYINGGDAEIFNIMHDIWEKDFIPTTKTMQRDFSSYMEGVECSDWCDIETEIKRLVGNHQIKVMEINGRSDDVLCYKEYKDEKRQLNVIAIGGDKLSRGLTLEGLTVSFFMRSSMMYDTLMQMGRWFGFRPTDEFDKMFIKLITEFKKYCVQENISFSETEIEEYILKFLDNTDEFIVSDEIIETEHGITPQEFAWYSFVKEHGENQTELYSFIASLTLSNTIAQALFYVSDTLPDYSNLNVYLDSPIIFSLLEMDEPIRTEAYVKLLDDIKKVKCNVCILDHNFQEVDGIVNRAASWATNTQYDIRKANNAARYFHDSNMDETQISEFCESIETRLNNLGITVKNTDYDVYQNQFQEDEAQLFEMVKQRYNENGYEISTDREKSIRTDIRSITMVYRERKGQTATRIWNSKHIMLTSNNVIANVSKKYESNQSTDSGHIPACISADLFGAILWLENPTEMIEYQKKKILSDCYAFLKPDKQLLDKYIESLDDARKADEIDEKKFLFLRSHQVVLDSLMNITKGDYARFTSKTYLEVYEDIQSKSLKEYRDEVNAHNETRQELERVKNTLSQTEEQKDQRIDELTEEIRRMKEDKEQEQKAKFEKKVRIIGTIAYIMFIGLPYLVLLIGIELLKLKFDDISFKSIIGIGGTIIATAITGIIFAKCKDFCLNKTRKFFENRE